MSLASPRKYAATVNIIASEENDWSVFIYVAMLAVTLVRIRFDGFAYQKMLEMVRQSGMDFTCHDNRHLEIKNKKKTEKKRKSPLNRNS